MNQLKLTEKEKLEYLRKIECTTKEDLLKKILKKLGRYQDEADKETRYPKEYYALIIVLLNRFKEMIQEAVLFDMLPDYWAYYLEFGYDEFSLNMYHMSSFEIDEDMAIRKNKVDAIYKLISLKPKAFSVEQYSKFYNVEQGTVRQWIRRGKIRSAYKEGLEWKIPELTPPPGKGYEGAQYQWLEGITNLSEEYDFLKDYCMATFYQDREDKKLYHVKLVSVEAYYFNRFEKNKQMTLDTKEREKLELYMISNPEIKYCGLSI